MHEARPLEYCMSLEQIKAEGWSETSGSRVGARLASWHDHANKLRKNFMKLTDGMDQTLQDTNFSVDIKISSKLKASRR